MCEVYGGKTDVEQVWLQSGGGATNAATSLTRLGFRTGSIFKVASDRVGQIIVDELKKAGLDLNLMIKQATGDSAISIILVAPDGGRSILTYRGVGGQVGSDEIPWGRLTSKWFYLSSLGGQMELVEDLFAYAHQNQIPICFNPGKSELGHASRLRKLLPKATLLMVNRLELSQLTDVAYEDEKGLIKAASKLGILAVVMTEGIKGARVIAAGRQFKAPAFRVKSVDDTGAGDAFGSAFLAGILQEKDLATCLKMGLANGASAVTQVGAKGGLLSESQMDRWLKKNLTIVEEKIDDLY